MRFEYDTGGRELFGYRGEADDCVCRAITIASGLEYSTVYQRLADGNAAQRRSKRASRATGRRTAREGINTNRKWFKDYMRELGFEWVPTMGIGTGCRVHLREDEVPNIGNYVVALSKHYTAVVDGVIRDTYDPSRNGNRCVYGWWEHQ